MRIRTFGVLCLVWLQTIGAIPSSQESDRKPYTREFRGVTTMCIDKKAFVAIIDAFKAGKDGKAIFDANDGCDSACFEGTLVRLIDTFKGPDTTPYEAFEARARNGTTLYITVSTPQEISDAEFDEMKSAACVPQ